MALRYLLLCYVFIGIYSNSIKAQEWRSSLYPSNWEPGFKDSANRFLHDFSYAGYHAGLKPLPNINSRLVDVTKNPYNADNSGKSDVTDIIQKAIDDIGKMGGGVIYFPEGEYAISLPKNQSSVIRVKYNNIVLRGAGTGKSFIKNTSTSFRSKTCILFEPSSGDWVKPVGNLATITKDISDPVTVIPVSNVAFFKPGDMVVLMTDCTDEFISEHKSQGQWSAQMRGVRICRIVKEVLHNSSEIVIDAPTRYYFKKRDNARVFKINSQLQECAIEDISIGNIQNQQADNWNDDNAFSKIGTGPYEVHASHLIEFKHAFNCWARNVSTYRPNENKDDFHTLSNCLLINESRFITLLKCNFQKSQYEGGGGNGYMYTLEGNDCLLEDCYAEDGRHNYDFKEMSSSGNVVLNCTSRNPRYASDFHMWLSMANLIDGFVSDGDYLEAGFRPYGSKGLRHMYTTTETVFWNTKGLKPHKFKFLIDSRQWGWGYVIGTSGTTNKVNTKPVSGTIDNLANGYYENQVFDTTPEDFVEGEGMGASLLPKSLYLDQLLKRKERIRLIKQ